MVVVKAEKLDETMDCAMVKTRALVRECEQVEKLVVWKVLWSEFLAVAKMASSMDIVGAAWMAVKLVPNSDADIIMCSKKDILKQGRKGKGRKLSCTYR